MNWEDNITWLSENMVLAIHNDQLYHHGGSQGIRDYNLFLATLDRPKHLLTYGDPPPSLFDLAASYAFGFTCNHVFVDGNKRTGLATSVVFLRLNDYQFNCQKAETVWMFEQLAEGCETQESISLWLEKSSTKIST